MARTTVELGENERAEPSVAEPEATKRERGCFAVALLWLDPKETTHSPTLVFGGPEIAGHMSHRARIRAVRALLVRAVACDAFGDAGAAACALESALDLALPESLLVSFLLHRAPQLLTCEARVDTDTPAISEVQGLGAGSSKPAVPPPCTSASPLEPLTSSETRVLHYLPTHLTAAEIARQLRLSVHTVNTHTRHLYAKLGAHRRHEAVDHARNLGLLAPLGEAPKSTEATAPARI